MTAGGAAITAIPICCGLGAHAPLVQCLAIEFRFSCVIFKGAAGYGFLKLANMHHI